MTTYRFHLYKRLLIGTIILGLAACCGKFFQRTNFPTGYLTRVFRNDTGDTRKYVLYVPPSHQLGYKPPVLMFLNGAGENGEDGIRQISNNFGVQVWEARDYFPFIAIAPQCRSDGSWAANSLDTKWAMEILDAVIREFDADPDRVYLTGVSSGGNGTWGIASAFPDRFAAVVPLCGGGGADAARLATAHLPIWNFINADDAVELVEYNRALREKLIRSGSSPLFTEYSDAGHDCWNRAYRSAALFEWLLSQRRSNNLGESLYQHLPAERLALEWQSAAGEWVAAKEGDVLELHSRGGESAMLVSPQSSAALDVHLDVWLRDQGCRFALTRDSGSPIWIVIQPAEVGSGGLAHSDGTGWARLDPAAQHSLRINAWNDVRVSLKRNRVTVHLNGLKAIDSSLDGHSESVAGGEYHFALVGPEAVGPDLVGPDVVASKVVGPDLVAPDEHSTCRWRFLRTRGLEGGPASHTPEAK